MRRWHCWTCLKRWTYDELPKDGRCPACGGLVTFIKASNA